MTAKKVRQPILEDGEKLEKKVRKQMGPQRKMDITAYIEEYPDKQLMLINDLDGDVQRWLDAGAEPVPSELKDRKIFKGLNDKADSQWVRFVGGSTATGEPYHVYCLMMDPELYHEYKHGPIEQRRADLKAAMTRGKTDEQGGEQLPGGGQVQTYAANLPDGKGQGYNQIRSK